MVSTNLIYVITLLIGVIFCGLLAGKDATSYLMKSNNSTSDINLIRIKRWHRDGMLIHAIFIAIMTWASHAYIETPIQQLLIRLAIFDILFNKYANLDIHYLGSTAWFDKLFVKIFGVNGAIEKSAVFLILLILWGIVKLFI